MICKRTEYDRYFMETFCRTKATPLRLVHCSRCPHYWAGKLIYFIERSVLWLQRKNWKNKLQK